MNGKALMVTAAALAAAACGDEGDFVVTPDDRFVLTFEDQFDGAEGTLPDLAVWQFDTGTGPNGDGWGNQELQFYTGRPDNVSLDGAGNLRITARRETFGNREYTSARLQTQDTFEQRYGRFEARVKIPAGTGLWPAFWMMGDNFPTEDSTPEERAAGEWPRCGEIDIFEFQGSRTTRVLGSVHGPGYSGGDAISGDLEVDDARLCPDPAATPDEVCGFDEDFHTYAIEWDPGRIAWFVDGELYHTIAPAEVRPSGDWVFNRPFFLLLNLAVGGNFVFPPNASTPFPAEMLIDYVRVYARAQQ